jgi:hypothetical protein
MPALTATIPATRFTHAVTFSVGCSFQQAMAGTDRAYGPRVPSFSVMAFGCEAEKKGHWLALLQFGGIGPSRDKKTTSPRLFKAWLQDRRAEPEQEEYSLYESTLYTRDHDDIPVRVRTVAEHDRDEDDYCHSSFSKILICDDPTAEPELVVQAITDTYTGRDDCWHDYDCCGCRTFHVSNARHVRDNLYAYDFSVSRNY